MGVAERFYEAFMVRDHYTMGLLYAEHATFSDPVFPLLNARGARMMWNMLLTRAEVPRSLPMIYWCIMLICVGGSRLLLR